MESHEILKVGQWRKHRKGCGIPIPKSQGCDSYDQTKRREKRSLEHFSAIEWKKEGEPLQSQADSDHTIPPAEEELQARIAKRAYELYEYRGWQHGHDQADWFQARKEALAHHGVRSKGFEKQKT